MSTHNKSSWTCSDPAEPRWCSVPPGNPERQSGYNGAASGWEVDRRQGFPGEATDAEVLAVGENPTGGAEMVFRNTPAGGWVFSASSLAFNGAVTVDPVPARLLANVLAMGAAPGFAAHARGGYGHRTWLCRECGRTTYEPPQVDHSQSAGRVRGR